MNVPRVSLLAAVLLLAGCGPSIRYAYHPPASAEGRVCTSQCANARQQCRYLLDAQYRDCQTRYSYAMHNYHQCRKGDAKHCYAPPGCFQPNTWQCDEDYRTCFQACGGEVEVIREPESKP